MIFKRKSFHLFRATDHISQADLEHIKGHYKQFTPLSADIKNSKKIQKSIQTSFSIGGSFPQAKFNKRFFCTLKSMQYIKRKIKIMKKEIPYIP